MAEPQNAVASQLVPPGHNRTPRHPYVIGHGRPRRLRLAPQPDRRPNPRTPPRPQPGTSHQPTTVARVNNPRPPKLVFETDSPNPFQRVSHIRRRFQSVFRYAINSQISINPRLVFFVLLAHL